MKKEKLNDLNLREPGDDFEDEEERYTLTPKGIFYLSVIDAGLADDLNDRRLDIAFELFEGRMRKHGLVNDVE